MEYLLANRIFMFFPFHSYVNYSVALRVAWHHPGICWGVMGLNQKDTPSRGMRYYYTVDCFRVILFFDLLGEECFFPPNPPLFLSSQRCFGLLLCSFVFECPHLYWARKNFAIVPCELIMISKQLLPPQGFGPEVKTRGGIIVVRA